MKKSPLIIGAAVVAIATQTANAAADSYIESDGTCGISTGYRMKGTSRLEVDFALTEQTEQARIFGDDAGFETSLKTILYVSGGASHFAMTTGDGTSSATRWKAGTDTGRHTAIIDFLNDKVQLFTGDTADLNTTTGLSGGIAGKEADMPLPLFGRWGNAYATKFITNAKARIYGVKIFENDVLVRNFVPCLKDGVACFKDLVGGGFIVGENVAAFTAGGDAPTYIDDGYVSTAANAVDGKLYIDTGYKVTDRTAVALDYAFTVNGNDNAYPGYWSLFECSGGTRFRIDFNKYTGLRYTAGGNDSVTTLSGAFDAPNDDRDVRRTVFLDNLNASVGVVMSGYTNQTATFTVDTASQPNGTTLKLASSAWGNDGHAAIRIYGCKIWEDGALVRDFVPYVENGIPGMRDKLTGAFIDGKDYSGGGNLLAYGGAIAGERDAYIQSAGTAAISTGHKMNGCSRVEVDFALSEASDYTQWRVFGTDGDTSFKTWLYIDGDSHYSMVFPWGQKWTTHTADTIRHTAIIDVNHGWAGLVTGTTTNWSSETSTSYVGQEADIALPLFGRNYAFAKERIYSVRIYESDALVHEFIPYSGDGIAGFYDTATGEIISNGSSFTFGGAGQDHGQLKAYIKPGYNDRIDYGGATQLAAYAPGATSYRWLRDGQPIEGGTDGVLAVEWARGGTKTYDGYVHTYQAVAVFNDFYGIDRESEPTVAATVTSAPLGMVISVR